MKPILRFSRRSFLFSGLGMVAVGLGLSRSSWAASEPISETDAMALALGYKHDTKKADSTKYPQLKKPETKSQLCSNCTFYAKEKGDWGKCQLLQNGLVNANGWCASWVKKA